MTNLCCHFVLMAAQFQYGLHVEFAFQLKTFPTRCSVVLASATTQLVEACWNVREVARGVR